MWRGEKIVWFGEICIMFLFALSNSLLPLHGLSSFDLCPGILCIFVHICRPINTSCLRLLLKTKRWELLRGLFAVAVKFPMQIDWSTRFDDIGDNAEKVADFSMHESHNYQRVVCEIDNGSDLTVCPSFRSFGQPNTREALDSTFALIRAHHWCILIIPLRVWTWAILLGGAFVAPTVRFTRQVLQSKGFPIV